MIREKKHILIYFPNIFPFQREYLKILPILNVDRYWSQRYRNKYTRIPEYQNTRIPEYLTGVDHLSPLVDSLVGRERRTTLIECAIPFLPFYPLSPLRRTRLSASETSFCPQKSGKAHLLNFGTRSRLSPSPPTSFPPQASHLAFGRLTLCRSHEFGACLGG